MFNAHKLDFASQVVFAVAGALCLKGVTLCFNAVMFSRLTPIFSKRGRTKQTVLKESETGIFYDFFA